MISKTLKISGKLAKFFQRIKYNQMTCLNGFRLIQKKQILCWVVFYNLEQRIQLVQANSIIILNQIPSLKHKIVNFLLAISLVNISVVYQDFKEATQIKERILSISFTQKFAFTLYLFCDENFCPGKTKNSSLSASFFFEFLFFILPLS